MEPKSPQPAPAAPNPAPPKNGDPALARYKRKRRLWLLAKILVVLVVLFLGALIYAQTSHAMLHVYLPFASKTLGTEITASSGSVNFNGTLRLANLKVMGSDGQPAFEADSIVAQVSPSSLMGGGIPNIKVAQLQNAGAIYRDLPGGSNNWSFLPQGGKEEKKPDRDGSFPKIRIDHVSIVNLHAQYADATGLTMNLKNLGLTAENLAPGSTGQFELGIEAQVQRPEPQLDETATLSVKGSLTQDAGGKELSYQGTTAAGFRGAGDSAAKMPSMDLAGTFDGKLTNQGAIQQNAQLSARTPQGSAGNFTTKINWDPAANAREAHVAISGVSREFLNPIIATFAPLQLAGAAINIKADVTGNSETVAFTTDFSARDLSFRVADAADPTPPVTVEFAQDGSFNLKDTAIAWKTMTMGVTNGGNKLVDLALDQPLSLKLGGGASDAIAGAAARVKLKINNLTVQTVRPWLAIAGMANVADLKSGRIDSDLTVGIEKQGAHIALSGTTKGTGIKYGDFAAVDFQKTVDVTLDDFDALKIQKGVFGLDAGGQRVADIAAGGDLSVKKQSGALNIQLSVPQVIGGARRLGLMTGDAPAGVSDGKFVASQKVQLGGVGGPLSLDGDARMEGVTLSVRGGAPVPMGLRVTNNITVDQKEGRVKIGQLRAEFDNPGSKDAGVAEVKGDWPLSMAGNAKGSIDATVSKVDLAPWLKLTHALGGEDLPPIPLEIKEAVERQADGRLALAGDVKVGLPIPAQGDQQAYQLNLEIHNELTQWGQQLEKILVDFSGKGGKGSDDKLHLEGAGSLGELTILSLKTDIASLRADPYLAAMKILTGNPPEETKETPAPAPAPAAAGPAAPPPVKLDAQWSIKEASMGTAKINDANGTLSFDKGAFDFKMPQGKIAGGAMTVAANGDIARAEPRFAWKVTLADTPVADLAGAANPDFAKKISGTVSMESEGTGEGASAASLQRKLDARTHFLVKDGELKNIPALDKLAEMTNSDSFKNVKFFKFEGNVNFAQGQEKGKIEQAALTGPEHKINFSGDVGLDTSYKIRIDPAITNKLLTGSKLQAYSALATDADGFVALPLALVVEGVGGQYSFHPTTNLPIPGMGGPGAPSLDQTLRGVLGGVVDKKTGANKGATATGESTATTTAPTAPAEKPSLEQSLRDAVNKKLGGDKTPEEKPAPAAAPEVKTAPAPATNEATTSGGAAAPTPKPQKTPKPTKEEKILNILGGALGK